MGPGPLRLDRARPPAAQALSKDCSTLGFCPFWATKGTPSPANANGKVLSPTDGESCKVSQERPKMVRFATSFRHSSGQWGPCPTAHINPATGPEYPVLEDFCSFFCACALTMLSTKRWGSGCCFGGRLLSPDCDTPPPLHQELFCPNSFSPPWARCRGSPTVPCWWGKPTIQYGQGTGEANSPGYLPRFGGLRLYCGGQTGNSSDRNSRWPGAGDHFTLAESLCSTRPTGKLGA
jgi:hypothetical protein